MKAPVVVFNALRTETERNEQTGLGSLTAMPPRKPLRLLISLRGSRSCCYPEATACHLRPTATALIVGIAGLPADSPHSG